MRLMIYIVIFVFLGVRKEFVFYYLWNENRVYVLLIKEIYNWVII